MRALFVALMVLVATPAWSQSACCGDVDVSGTVGVVDVLRVLRGSIGTATCIPSCCDTDDSGAVNVTDALATLRAVFGAPVSCPDTELEITYVASGSDPVFPPIAGVNIEVDLSASGVTLTQGPDQPDCVGLPAGGVVAWNVVGNELRYAYVDPGGFPEPLPLLLCAPTVVSLVDGSPIPVNVVEAVRTNFVVSPDLPDLFIEIR